MYVIFPAQELVDFCYFPATVVNPLQKMSSECTLKELSHPALNEALKLHNAVTFKLVKTVSDFAQQLASIHEQHAEELQLLVETFRKRNADLRRERPLYPSMLFASWETFLQEVEVDSQVHSDIASILARHVSVPILERTFHRKVQSRKVFMHRESCETILGKTEELLFKCHKDYSDAYERLMSDRSPNATEAYVDAHNAYVQQLHSTNAMIEEYHNQTLPQILEEMEEVYLDLSDTVARSVLEGAEIISTKAQEAFNRYDSLFNLSKTVNSKTDLGNYIKTVNVDLRAPPDGHKHEFSPPQLDMSDPSEIAMSPAPIPILKDEVIIDKSLLVPMRSKFEALKKEAFELESKMRSLQEALESLVRLQQRSLDSSLFNKANEIQEDISMKRFDLRVAQIHLSAVRAQMPKRGIIGGCGGGGGGGGDGGGGNHKGRKRGWASFRTLWKFLMSAQSQARRAQFLATKDRIASAKKIDLLAASLESKSDNNLRERKMSGSSTGSIKNKWLKAFKSLKSGSSSSSGSSGDRKSDKKDSSSSKDNGSNSSNFETAHIFQEYTYKKITPCDFCHEILRGHTRQGLRCKMCKMNVHADCQEKVNKCQPKPRLLRRQKSTSEIETKVSDKEDDTRSVGNASLESSFLFPYPLGTLKLKKRSLPSSAEPVEIDPIYQLLKQAGDLGGGGGGGGGSGGGGGIKKSSVGSSADKEMTTGTGGGGGSGGSSGSSMSSLNKRNSSSRTPAASNHSLAVSSHPPPSSCSAPHSPQRHKLNLRMKSLSLDSPESNEHVQRRRHHGTNPHSSHGSSHSQSPQSPVHSRRLLSTRVVRMSSVDLPDDNEKSLSSASTSPCPSPKPHRLLPTNLYVVLYNFKSRHQDELDLKAGYTVTVIDTSDPDWWKGKCLGKVGYFPSKYVAKLNPGERPLQVTHNLQVSDGDNGIKLLRDQIVIQVSEENAGMVPIRCGDRQGVCPLKYLQEV